jgi:hypothetical protein
MPQDACPMFDAVQTLVFALALALGFAISGVFANVFELVTNERSIFHLPISSDGRRLAIVGILLLAAPHVVLRAAGRALRRDEVAPAYLFGFFGLSSLWSFGLGFLALNLLIS